MSESDKESKEEEGGERKRDKVNRFLYALFSHFPRPVPVPTFIELTLMSMSNEHFPSRVRSGSLTAE